MINFNPKDRYGFEDLVEIMAILRSPEGCPWDREQTHESIRNNFLEEVYEAVTPSTIRTQRTFGRNWGM